MTAGAHSGSVAAAAAAEAEAIDTGRTSHVLDGDAASIHVVEEAPCDMAIKYSLNKRFRSRSSKVLFVPADLSEVARAAGRSRSGNSSLDPLRYAAIGAAIIRLMKSRGSDHFVPFLCANLLRGACIGVFVSFLSFFMFFVPNHLLRACTL